MSEKSAPSWFSEMKALIAGTTGITWMVVLITSGTEEVGQTNPDPKIRGIEESRTIRVTHSLLRTRQPNVIPRNVLARRNGSMRRLSSAKFARWGML